jgi:hypothetical protein
MDIQIRNVLSLERVLKPEKYDVKMSRGVVAQTPIVIRITRSVAYCR